MNIAWQMKFTKGSQLCDAFVELMLTGFSFSLNTDNNSLHFVEIWCRHISSKVLPSVAEINTMVIYGQE